MEIYRGSGPITCVADAAEIDAMVVGDSSGTVAVIDARSGDVRRQIKCDNIVLCVAYASDLKAVITGEGSMVKEEFKVMLWDVVT